MTLVEGLSWTCSVSAMASTLLVYHPKPKVQIIGPILGMLTQPVWAVFGLIGGGTGLVLTATFFFFIHIKGYRKIKQDVTR